MDSCCETDGGCATEMKMESVITVDERGQMVLPKDVRQRLNIQPGEKLVLVSCQQDGEMCCMSLIKTDVLNGMVRNFLGPMMSNLAG